MKYLFILLSILTLVTISSCTVASYTISFDSQGGSNIEPFSTSFVIQTALPTPVKEGYTFIGWSLAVDGEVITDLRALEKRDYLLYAIWNPLNSIYTLTFKSEEMILDEVLLSTGQTITLIETPLKTGYTFNGWFLDQTFLLPFDFTVMPNKDIILYAKFDLNEINIWSFETLEETETTLKLRVRISGIVEFIGFNAEITFDASKLTLKQVRSDLSVVINQMTSSLKFNYVNALNKTTVSTNVLELTFTKLSNQSLKIDLDVVEMITIDSLYNISNIDFSIISYNGDKT
jgi:uncharacterized repeat protein (TIGR02543 family)